MPTCARSGYSASGWCSRRPELASRLRWNTMPNAPGSHVPADDETPKKWLNHTSASASLISSRAVTYPGRGGPGPDRLLQGDGPERLPVVPPPVQPVLPVEHDLCGSSLA